MSVDWPDVERAMCRIPHVTRAHVVPDEQGEVLELHIVATPGKHPKQVVRDVQSLARAAFGVDVDRHVVSVVQLEDEEPAVAQESPRSIPSQQVGGRGPAAGRVALSGMTLQSLQGASSISVVLMQEERRATGAASRSTTAGGLHRMAAEATLAALVDLQPDMPTSDVDGVEVRPLGAGKIALVSVASRRASSEQVLVGKAAVGAAGELDAIARAVLDAFNRRLRS